MEFAGASSLQHLQALSNLLSTQQEDGDDEDCKNINACCPGLVLDKLVPHPKQIKKCLLAYVKKNSKDIWSEEEVAEGCQYEDDNDPRPQPEYEIILKQRCRNRGYLPWLEWKRPILHVL
ncbi:hypothetical protein KUCAC02_018428 [Chaenocephalus aceratus]|uniref:Uncharacterized protein n=1 Tax=Chaenocephalus aceratus TaxID=36190 RepID=A0ACB9W9D7_CHAAC|nr:hypothetical protein KUCAC02_018428 [Chaenocephalus aceratus]